jgi:hypothetical protein
MGSRTVPVETMRPIVPQNPVQIFLDISLLRYAVTIKMLISIMKAGRVVGSL